MKNSWYEGIINEFDALERRVSMLEIKAQDAERDIESIHQRVLHLEGARYDKPVGPWEQIAELKNKNRKQADYIEELEADNRNLSARLRDKCNRNFSLHAETDELKEKNDTLSGMLRGMARRASHERRTGRLAEPTPEHPDLIDRDGDRWEWTPAHGAYRTVSGVYRLADREDIDRLAGPVKEAE